MKQALSMLLQRYKGTDVVAPIAVGVRAFNHQYDCHCGVDDCNDCYNCHCSTDDCTDCYDCHCGLDDCAGDCIGPG